MPNGFLDVTVKTSPNFSAFKIGVQSGMRPLVWAVHRRCFRCVRLSIAFPAPGLHLWERPSMCPQPDLNRHTKALAIELQGHVRLAVCTAIVIICEVYRARSHRQVATLPSGTAHRSCTFATSCAAPLPNTCLNLVWITSQCLVGYAAYKKSALP